MAIVEGVKRRKHFAFKVVLDSFISHAIGDELIGELAQRSVLLDGICPAPDLFKNLLHFVELALNRCPVRLSDLHPHFRGGCVNYADELLVKALFQALLMECNDDVAELLVDVGHLALQLLICTATTQRVSFL